MKTLITIFVFVLSLHANSTDDNSVRYFGGHSQGELILPKSTTHTAPLVTTEEVFSAKSASDIDKVVESNQLKDIASGKTAKEFLEDKTGHLYGGLSENKITLEN